MGVQCGICTHPERAAIEQDLAAGVGPTRVARRFKVSKHAAARHRDMHLVFRPEPHRLQGAGVAMIGLRGFAFTVRKDAGAGAGDVEKC